jgi:hypothetical protein
VGFAILTGAAAIGGVLWVRGRVGPPAPAPSRQLGDTDGPAVPLGRGPAEKPATPAEKPATPAEKPATPLPPPAKTFAPEPSVGFAGDLEWTRPVETADMTKVDIGDLFAQARPIADKLQPGAQLVNIVAFDITGGVADLTGESRVMYEFEFAGTDPSQPPGKDSVEFRVDVEAKAGALTGRRMKWPASHLKHFGGAIEPPKCSSATMWATATGSGVPSNAVATIHFYQNRAFSPQAPFVWSVRVEGHDEYRREIDGKTCAMVKNWGKK